MPRTLNELEGDADIELVADMLGDCVLDDEAVGAWVGDIVKEVDLVVLGLVEADGVGDRVDDELVGMGTTAIPRYALFGAVEDTITVAMYGDVAGIE